MYKKFKELFLIFFLLNMVLIASLYLLVGEILFKKIQTLIWWVDSSYHSIWTWNARPSQYKYMYTRAQHMIDAVYFKVSN